MNALLRNFTMFFVLTSGTLKAQENNLNFKENEIFNSQYYLLNVNYSNLLMKKWIRIDSVKINEKVYKLIDSIITYKIDKKEFDYQSSLFINIYLNNQEYKVPIIKSEIQYCSILDIKYKVTNQRYLMYYMQTCSGQSIADFALTQTSINIYRAKKIKFKH